MSERSVLENVDTTELLKHVDVEEVLKQVDLWNLLREVNLESVLGGFGAAAGGELGTKLGRRLDATFGTGADGTGEDETEGDEDTSSASTDDETADGDSTEESDESESDGDESESSESGGSGDAPAEPESRADLEDLSYRELQTLAKDTDVKGNISQERLVDGLAEAFGFDEE